jgi:DNA (cytosine-5)-methyltransferase 1
MKSGSNSRKPTLVSLFTGAGGLDIGLELAGFSTVAAVDSDKDCVETLRLNRGRLHDVEQVALLDHANVIPAKVEELEPKDLRPKGSAASWSPDVLVGGPPCQPFSSAGRMLGLDDPRGRLFEDFVKLADGLRPRLILFENVRGLVTSVGPSGRPGEALELVKKSFERIGYATSFALLNAADYGLPQRRVRLFMMATRDCPLPVFPQPTHAEETEANLFGRQLPWVSLGELLRPMPPADEEDIDLPSPALAKALATVSEGSGLKSAGAREATRPGGHWGYKQGTFVADLSKPARTVTAAATQDWIRDAQGRLRRLTWRECAALQGFPNSWEFVGNKASRFRQIGNAVPVVFGRILGRALLDSLRAKKPRIPVRSAALPERFTGAIAYTHSEHRRNGASRAAAREALAAGRMSFAEAKGLGSAEQDS